MNSKKLVKNSVTASVFHNVGDLKNKKRIKCDIRNHWGSVHSLRYLTSETDT